MCYEFLKWNEKNHHLRLKSVVHACNGLNGSAYETPRPPSIQSPFILIIFYLFILLYKSYSKYKKKIQQLYKNKRTKITNGKI